MLNVCYIVWVSYLPPTYLALQVSQNTLNNCWQCQCLFDDTILANVTNETLELYNPDARGLTLFPGTGPINKTEANMVFPSTCYKLTDPTSAPSSAPIATTSAPTGKPIATTSASTGKPNAITSAPTDKPIVTTSTPTGKPTAASKSSKSVKATKVPSAKSAKSAKSV